MTRTRYYVAILMMGMFYLLMTTPAQAATLNVDQNDPNCSDSSGGPYCTIQAAIDAASANDTIEIASGVYAEFLSVDKPLTLSGPNAGTPGYWSPRTDEAIIVPPDNSHAQAIIRVVADDVTIDGVTVDGNNPNLSGSIDINGVDVNASTGIIVPNYEDSCGNNFQNITIRNNIIQNLNWYGFYGGGCPGNNSTLSENNLIEYNYVDNMPNRTVAVGPIQGDRGRRGIGFYNEFHATVQNNEITRVLRGIQNGATFVNTSGTYYIQNNTISSSGIGIWHNLWSSGTPPYIIRDNTLTSDDGPSGGNSGIAISSISGNATFTNNHVTNSDEGIFLSNNSNSGNVTINGGTIENVNDGIDVNDFYGGNTATINDVNLRNIARYGIYLHDDNGSGSQTHTITVNNLTMQDSPGATGVEMEDSDGAQNNNFTLQNASFDGMSTGINITGGDVGNTNVQDNSFSNNDTGVNNTSGTTLDIQDNTYFNNTSDTSVDVNNNNPTTPTENPAPTLPTASDDSATTAVNTPVTIDVLANDSGNLQPSTVTIVGVVVHGEVSVSGSGEVEFTPTEDFTGQGTFKYTVTDEADFTTDPATVTIDIAEEQQAEEPQQEDPNLVVSDPAVSKAGFLLPGDTGVQGERLEWVVTVQNTGDVPYNDLTITDNINPNLSVDRVSDNVASQIDGQTVTVTVDTLDADEGLQFSIFTTVLEGTEITNEVCTETANTGQVCAEGTVVRELPQTGESQR